MKTDFQPIKKINMAEAVLTLMVLALVGAMTLAGMHLIGVIHLPVAALPYIGGALLAFVVIGGFVIVHNCVKFMLKKGE